MRDPVDGSLLVTVRAQPASAPEAWTGRTPPASRSRSNQVPIRQRQGLNSRGLG
jgi:hypothetical protein